MEITKIANLSVEEKELLIKAGEIIGSFNQAKLANEVDILSEDTKNLFLAIREVLNKVVE